MVNRGGRGLTMNFKRARKGVGWRTFSLWININLPRKERTVRCGVRSRKGGFIHDDSR